MNDPFGRFGFSCLSLGYLFNVITRTDIGFWVGITCTSIGGLYYLIKIYFDFIKKK